jgi:hypothetical protein
MSNNTAPPVAVATPTQIIGRDEVPVFEDPQVREMWSSGEWRNPRVFRRWLDQLPPRSIRPIVNLPWRYAGMPYLQGVQCLVADDATRCGIPRLFGASPRLTGAMMAALPVATGYVAYRKSDGSPGWTAAGAAAGMFAPVALWWAFMLGGFMIFGSPRY